MIPNEEPDEIIDWGAARAEQVARYAIIWALTALGFILLSVLRFGLAVGRGIAAGVVAFNTARIPPAGVHIYAPNDVAVGADDNIVVENNDDDGHDNGGHPVNFGPPPAPPYPPPDPARIRLMPPAPVGNNDRWYIVTVGREVGVIRGWLNVGPLVLGHPASVYLKVESRADGVARFNEALANGLVRAL